MTVPDGSAESFDGSIDWVGANLEFPPEQWDGVRRRANMYNIRVIPWIRLCHPNLGEDFNTIKQRLVQMIGVTRLWGDNIILPNYEVEASTYQPSMVADFLYNQAKWNGETGWSTLAWLQNDVDWTPITKDPVLLQIFPNDAGWSPDEVKEKQDHCVYHAREKGFTYVGVTFQTYGDPPGEPSWYDVSGPHSVFPGNRIPANEWADWFP